MNGRTGNENYLIKAKISRLTNRFRYVLFLRGSWFFSLQNIPTADFSSLANILPSRSFFLFTIVIKLCIRGIRDMPHRWYMDS